MIPRPLLVTGCARSGTKFMAEVLARCDLPASHEFLFNPYTPCLWPPGHQGIEVSWLAAPFLREMPPYMRIVHQIRNPYRVVRSLVGIRLFENDHVRPYRDFIYKHAPLVAAGPTGLDRAIAYCILWNRMSAERAELTLRIEDLTIQSLSSMLESAGMEAKAVTINDAFRSVQPTMNARSHERAVTAQEMLDSRLGPWLKTFAEEYGYEP